MMESGDSKKANRLAYASIILTIAFGLTSIFGITVSPTLFDTGNPAVFSTLTIFIALMSGFVGWQIRKSMVNADAVKAAAAERVRLENEEKERERKRASRRKEEIDASARDFMEDQCGEKKAMSAVIYRLPGHRASLDCKGVAEIESLENNYGHADRWINFFMTDARGDDVTYVVLEEWLVELFDAKPELLDDFTPAMLDECQRLLHDCSPF